jgi:DNA/RNA endonuclease YhcR with UshA esterase domain
MRIIPAALFTTTALLRIMILKNLVDAQNNREKNQKCVNDDAAKHYFWWTLREAMMQLRMISTMCLVIIVLVACSERAEDKSQSSTEAAIAPRCASRYIGEVKTVCGNVSRISYLPLNRGQPTYLTLGVSYSKEICRIVIWGKDRSKFSEPLETLYKDKRIKVRGLLKKYRNHPQIKVTSPEQITIIWEPSDRPDSLKTIT